jgi:hypothetical protein
MNPAALPPRFIALAVLVATRVAVIMGLNR